MSSSVKAHFMEFLCSTLRSGQQENITATINLIVNNVELKLEDFQQFEVATLCRTYAPENENAKTLVEWIENTVGKDGEVQKIRFADTDEPELKPIIPTVHPISPKPVDDNGPPQERRDMLANTDEADIKPIIPKIHLNCPKPVKNNNGPPPYRPPGWSHPIEGHVNHKYLKVYEERWKHVAKVDTLEELLNHPMIGIDFPHPREFEYRVRISDEEDERLRKIEEAEREKFFQRRDESSKKMDEEKKTNVRYNPYKLPKEEPV